MRSIQFFCFSRKCYIILLVFCLSCIQDRTPLGAFDDSLLVVPVQTDDGWQVGHPRQVGMNTAPLIRMLEYLYEHEHRIHNILIVKNDRLVFEKYFDGYMFQFYPPGTDGANITYGMDTLHYEASVSKSVTSLLVGIAVDQGFIHSVDDLISDYFPQHSHILAGEKAGITIRQLLTMTAGLAWDENTYPYTDPRNDIMGMFTSTDPIAYILERPLISTPGSSFHYNSGNTNVLGEIVRTAADQNLRVFAEENLFGPLSIHRYRWETIRGEVVFASGGLYLRPRDLAKMGSLILNGGQWQGQQIISAEWLDFSLQNYATPGMLPGAYGYGFQWWLGRYASGNRIFHSCFAAGWGEQYLFVFPDQQMIVVFNGGYYLHPVTVSPFDLLQYFLLDAVSG